jgi:preprotein translocase subunit SecE
MADSAKSEAKKESFWKGVKTEFKKIAWPDRKETVKQSVAVLCVSVLLLFWIRLSSLVLTS